MVLDYVKHCNILFKTPNFGVYNKCIQNTMKIKVLYVPVLKWIYLLYV